jgi:repressor LexA
VGRSEDIIRDKIVSEYGSLRKFAEAINVPNTTLHTTLERGIRATNSVDVVLRVFKELNLDVDAFVGGMVRKRDSDTDYIDIPIYGSIAAGTPIEMVEVEDYYRVSFDIRGKYPNAFFLRVEGESMNRRLPNGCLALIDPDQKEAVGSYAYAVCVNGHDATIKQVRLLNNGAELIPDSYDPTYQREVYNYNENAEDIVTVIGRVVWYAVPLDYSL